VSPRLASPLCLGVVVTLQIEVCRIILTMGDSPVARYNVYVLKQRRHMWTFARKPRVVSLETALSAPFTAGR